MVHLFKQESELMVGVFFCLTLLIPLFVRRFRSRANLIIAYWCVIMFHQVVAFCNAFLFKIVGADKDAESFHRLAIELAQSRTFLYGFEKNFYINLLSVLYRLFDPSRFLGAQLSILAFAASCVVLIKILHLLELSRYEVPILLVFGLIPSVALFGSVTLREPYELLFFMLATYYGIKMHMTNDVSINLFKLCIFAMFMGVFQKGLLVFSFFLIFLFLVWTPRPASSPWYIKKLRLLIPFTLIGAYLFSRVSISGFDSLHIIFDENLFEYVEIHRKALNIRRASYFVPIDTSSLLMGTYSLFTVYFHYMFSPFPWDITNAVDLYASAEGIFRTVLLYFSVKCWHNAYGQQRRLLGLMLFFYISMTCMWALGTGNYGTAIRHHMISWWIIVIIGLPLLMTTLGRVRLRIIKYNMNFSF